MPQDPNLYGQKPAKKKQKREITLSSSLAFTSQLSSLISASTTTSSSSGRPRPSKTKDDIFSVKAKRKPGTKTKLNDDDDAGGNSSKIRLKHVHGTEEEKQDFARARRKMEEKARLYAAMKRGDYVAKENEAAPLVDFDRKWAERHPEEADERYSSSGGDDESSDDDNNDGREMVEYQDEFGRTRVGTRAEVQRQERRAARAALGAAELKDMAAVPTVRPRNLIFGDAIQTGGVRARGRDAGRHGCARGEAGPDADAAPRRPLRRDRGDPHQGTGFVPVLARRGDAREGDGEPEAERENTERARRARETEKERRRKEIAERRKKIGKRRAEKMADSFLDGLAGEIGMLAGRAGNDDGDNGGEVKDEGKSEPVAAPADA
ncbi:hypothetical protein CIB48_g6809 [Xylaria polymorpha]|nr:hypothetical protein CIB48_g6809 [Xylaria polymorpha]